jgi:peptide deformylase
MARIRKLVVYPDPLLHRISDPVTNFDPKYLQPLIDDMFITMECADGVGLSAIQIGEPKRIIIAQDETDQYCLINPGIVSADGKQTFEEGCLSVPGVYEERERAEHITVRFHNVLGEEMEEDFSGLAAFCIQHEIDHLNGKVFIDDLSPLKKNRARDKIKKTVRKFQKDLLKQKTY